MKKLQMMSVDELVHAFVEIAIEQDKALKVNQTQSYRRLFKMLSDIEAELKSRSDDRRRELIVLYRHSNLQVRLRAAHATLAIAPIDARAEIQKIYDSKVSPQSLDAGMTLTNLDRGIYLPT